MDQHQSPGIVVDDLVKRYAPGSPPAVDGLSFEVRPGEIYGFLGPNGSGKSTTIGVLATLLLPTSGTVHVAGFDVVGQAVAVRRRIGVALQETGVDFAATGPDLIARHARLLGISRPEAGRRADELLREKRPWCSGSACSSGRPLPPACPACPAGTRGSWRPVSW